MHLFFIYLCSFIRDTKCKIAVYQIQSYLIFKYFYTTMSEEKALIQVLGQVVQQLQKYVTKLKEEELPPVESKHLAKTSDMSYIDFIKKALEIKGCSPGKFDPPTLHHDLILIQELSECEEVTLQVFKKLGEKLSSTAECLKSRYEEYLQNLSSGEMKQIAHWIEQNGICGELVKQNEKIIVRAIKKEDVQDFLSGKRQRSASQDSELKKSPRKKSKLPQNCRELSSILQYYSKVHKISIEELASLLDKVSGNVNDLEKYLETRDSRLLWAEEDDAVLKASSGVQFELLKKYRGLPAVKKRKQYLGLE